MKYFVIIPVHNRMESTRKVLNSLKQQNNKRIMPIIVDDGSEDNYNILKEEFDDKNFSIIILKGDGNLWWAGSINMGISYCTNFAKNDDYFVFMNNDVDFDKHFFSVAEKIIKENPNAIFGPLVADKNKGCVLQSGIKMLSWPLALTARPFEGEQLKKVLSTAQQKIYVDFIGGRATFVPHQVIKQIGTVAWKDLPQYHADGEFSFRAKKNGFSVFFTTDLIVYTNTESTSNVKNYQKRPSFKNILKSFYKSGSPNNLSHRIKFARRVAPKKWLPLYIFSDFIKTIFRLVFHLILGKKIIQARSLVSRRFIKKQKHYKL